MRDPPEEVRTGRTRTLRGPAQARRGREDKSQKQDQSRDAELRRGAEVRVVRDEVVALAAVLEQQWIDPGRAQKQILGDVPLGGSPFAACAR